MAEPTEPDYEHKTEAVARLLFKTVIYVARCVAKLESESEEKPGVFSECTWNLEQRKIDVICKSWGNLIKFIDKRDKKTLQDTDIYGARSSLRSRFTPALQLLSNELGLAVFHNEQDVIKKRIVPKEFTLIKLPENSVAIDDCLKVFDKSLLAYHTRQNLKEDEKRISSLQSHAKCQVVPTNVTNYIPALDSDFVGTVRTTDLEEIHAYLKSKQVKPLVLTGMGGLGKTTLVIQYVNQYINFYPNGCCWIKPPISEDKDNRFSERAIQIVEFAKLFKVYIDDSIAIESQLAQAWRGLKDDLEILFVVDDIQGANEILGLIPQNKDNFTFIGTSRQEYVSPKVKMKKLALPSLEDAIEQLKTFVNSDKIEAEIDTVIEILGTEVIDRLPLAITLLGGYLVYEEISFVATLNRLVEIRKRWEPGEPGIMADPSLEDLANLTREQLGVAAIFDLTWQKLETYCQKAAKILGLFSHTFIDWSVLEEATYKGHAELKDADFSEENIRLARSSLKTHNLIKKLNIEGEGHGYSCHALVGDFFRSKASEEDKQEWFDYIEVEVLKSTVKKVPQLRESSSANDLAKCRRRLNLLEKASSRPDFIDESSILKLFLCLACLYQQSTEFEKTISIGKAAVKHTKERFGLENPTCFMSINSLAMFYKWQGRYSEAEPLLELSLELRQLVLEENHPDIAVALNNLGMLCINQGQYNKAGPLLRQALEMRQRRDHPEVADSLNNLATLYGGQGRYSKAESLLRQALKLNQKNLGKNHPNVATNINNLGMLCIKQGQYNKAEPLLKQALEIRQQVLSKDHPLIAGSLSNLAELYEAQGRYNEAEPIHIQALELHKKLLGSNHPNVAVSLNALGVLYAAQGQYNRAESLLEEALEIRQQVFGKDHPDIAQSLNSLASLYTVQGQYGKAETLCKEALEIRQQVFGKDHPNIAQSLNSLVVLYVQQKRYSEAETLCKEALEIRQQALGKDHIEVATSFQNLAMLYAEQKQYDKAEPVYIQALESYKKLLGDNHPHVASILNNLATLYSEQKRYSEAESLFQQVLEKRKQILGKAHPDVANSLNNLAMLYEDQGRHSEAEPLLQQSLEIHKQVFGDNHPNVAVNLSNLAELYKEQSRYEEAILLYIGVLELSKQNFGDSHLKVASCLSNLAKLYEKQNQHEEAIMFYTQALESYKQLLGPEHPQIASILNNLGIAYLKQKKYDKAKPIYLNALELNKKLLGEKNVIVALNLRGLAEVYKNQGQLHEAEGIYIQSLELCRELLGNEGPGDGSVISGLKELVLSDLEEFYRVQGKLEKAEAIKEQSKSRESLSSCNL